VNAGCAHDARLACLLCCPCHYPSFEGETQKNPKRAKEDVVRIMGREFRWDLNIDTSARIIDDPHARKTLSLIASKPAGN
jgi:hypothetical protein